MSLSPVLLLYTLKKKDLKNFYNLSCLSIAHDDYQVLGGDAGHEILFYKYFLVFYTDITHQADLATPLSSVILIWLVALNSTSEFKY